LVPGGTLLTTTFLQKEYYKSTKQYLEAILLGIKVDYWTKLFQFCAMGYESSYTASPACKILAM